ncbi:MAG TPA: DUF3488 and transglutaminase-like domain-containing protein, partial [Tepidisphaeraceae bacterium]
MYDIRQFRPALYVLLIMGITGFALASQVPGIWVLAVGAILLNAWLVKTGRFRPLPRLVANLVTLIGLAVLAFLMRSGGAAGGSNGSSGYAILIIGQFLVLLQIVKVYEQRANRDYAQLLVLSLLLMVAGAISTYSLAFGLLFILYLFLSLYCCLLFHLKVETDHAKQAIGIPEEKLNPATLRQDERYLASSMRRLTAFVSSFSVTTAVLTFLFFPRGPGAGILPLQWKTSQTLTGFSDSVDFQHVASITQNTAKIAFVTITKDGNPWHATGPLLLRGTTLDRYSGDGAPQDDEPAHTPYQWTRNVQETNGEDVRGEGWRDLKKSFDGSDGLLQQINLDPTGTPVLFAIGGIISFKPNDLGRYRYSRDDEVLQADAPIIQNLHYEVKSQDLVTEPGYQPPGAGEAPRRERSGNNSPVDPLTGGSPPPGMPGAPSRTRIDPKIAEFARLPEVSGSDAQGPLAPRRDPTLRVTPLDAQIAQNIETYLRTNFTYTLDLTDALRIGERDPMVAFLYDLKRGHCEYFAGAMTLMCQSFGMQARMVVGFKCDEYNELGAYYTVRQSHAHAWVEVLDSTGIWRTFDPTSGREAPVARSDSVFQRLRSIFNYLEYTWANTVVAYDRDSRNSVINNVEQRLTTTAAQSGQLINTGREWLNTNTYSISSKAIGGMIGLMICAIILSVVWFFYERWKLRQRARRIGLDVLPAPQKMK